MADLVIAPTDVKASNGFESNVQTSTSGEAIAAGETVRIDSTTRTMFRSNKAADAAASVDGIAVNSSNATGQPVSYLPTGAKITVGAVVTIGETYVVSAIGKISPVADLASAENLSYVGYGVSATEIQIMAVSTGVKKA